jgi:hypothetical protein
MALRLNYKTMQYFKTENYYVCLWDKGMILIEYRSWMEGIASVVRVDEYTFPRDWNVFFEKFKVADLKPIGEHEFENMYILSKLTA